jgi:hypothetical protein
METFAAGDRVVAINTDMSGPIYDPKGHPTGAFAFPDGPLRKGAIYHVRTVQPLQSSGYRPITIGVSVSFYRSRTRVFAS